MASNRHIVLFVLFHSILSKCYENGVEGSVVLSKEEDTEIEKQLKILNKPAVITIQSKFGDLYDCVDFYKQPAFDHPMLQNHSFYYQMKPTWRPEMPRENGRFAYKTNHPRPTGFGCPFGTVPIRRVTKHDLIRQTKSKSDIYKANNVSKFKDVRPSVHHYAQVQTGFDPNRKYTGGGASFTTGEPSGVDHNQYSLARVKIRNGPDNIQAGGIVNPDLYGNGSVRLFVYTETSQLQCFNVQCHGFVLNNDFPLDVPLYTSRGDIGDTIFYIYRDVVNGNWWLEYQQVGIVDRVQVGFWRQKIFTGLKDLATMIEYGGEVSSPPLKPSPPMGDGYIFEGRFLHDAGFFSTFQVNETGQVVENPKFEPYCDVDKYHLKEVRVRGHWRKPMNVMLYGGPGGAF